jgi:hypothetical protein
LLRKSSMGEVINLDEYRQKTIDNEIKSLQNELEIIMDSWPEDLHQAYFISLEEQKLITDRWTAFGEKKEK